MGKNELSFICEHCRHKVERWIGRCPACQHWDTLKSLQQESAFAQNVSTSPRPICDIAGDGIGRLPTGIAGFDRVLGGGIADEAVMLFGGEPGSGKSTLTIWVCELLARKGLPILYATGEESAEQVAERGRRLGVKSKNLLVFASQEIEEVLKETKAARPALLVVDSLQSMRSHDLKGAPGGTVQIKRITNTLAETAKTFGLPILIICHIVKDGKLSGPKALEHIVDVVLGLKVDDQKRALQASKNRFGSTEEIGLFTMTSSGLLELPEDAT